MEDKVVQILAEVTSMSPDEIAMDANLQQDLGLNSLDVINLIVEFEETFNIVIDETDIRTFQTVGDLVDYLQRQPSLVGEAQPT